MLSSATIMNGTFSKGRQSVFAILDRLKSPWAHNHPRADGSGGAQEGHEERLEEDDNSSVMLYGPLSPDSDSVVELAQSEVISLGEDEEPGTPTVVGYNDNPEQPAAGEPSQNSGTRKGWPNLQWPWYGMKGKARAEASEKRVHVGEKIWVPSRTKISLQVMWWGYRIYLPPPVLAVLSNQELTAAKRAAMFTTALKWLCDHIPVSLLPLQLRPAAILVRRLIPYVGYIGGFVAWSWSAVKSYDKGNGVVLTATWLLSVAVIPSTWEPNNPPTSPEAPGLTVPLPSQPQTPQVGTSNRA
ncbi:hypothetical protein GLOTRDRAFT_67779 [Gloeophyllum trabeum ATCC 11539]|uniref:Uncharacterized protein n=1 Tax=Gloeophyllum trabeum (strain ATCC 11539 / FP-39264 / Madison 617) TaxID=670483 RepID=S7QKK1_GLOTA|nr:uncharacterized protein GLOTRDRAFT_67779 [Gloeophyllum trabeum ATCC 11539]EPQ60301.1 hypothetical protein GLOTRDRAFT_67779 [Gloeophyllum trabeum ATCC 11539]